MYYNWNGVDTAGCRAPPDLLAPSFIEFLGSTTSSRCSNSSNSRRNTSIESSSSPLLQRTTGSTTHDVSLPDSMAGKKVLRSVQQESQQLLAMSRKILELQQNKPSAEKENLPLEHHNIDVCIFSNVINYNGDEYFNIFS